MRVRLLRLGRTDYARCMELQQLIQRRTIEAAAASVPGGASAAPGDRPRHESPKPYPLATLLVTEHDPVFSVGRMLRGDGDSTDFRVPRTSVPVVHSTRGGRVTWHGPGQLVMYPIFALNRSEHLRPSIRWFIERLLAWQRAVLQREEFFGAPGARLHKEILAGPENELGVYVRDVGDGVAPGDAPRRKLAACGFSLSRWVTMHGIALNVSNDLTAFNEEIVPCGLSDVSATSMSAELGRLMSPRQVEQALTDSFTRDAFPGLHLEEDELSGDEAACLQRLSNCATSAEASSTRLG